MSSVLIKNERYDRNLIDRRLAISNSDTLTPCKVWRSDTGNDPEKKGTYQKIEDGDILINVTIKEDFDPVIEFFQVTIHEGDTEETIIKDSIPLSPTLMELLNKPVIKDWLYFNGKKPFLPANVGWDGENSVIDLTKLNSVLMHLPANLDFDVYNKLKGALKCTGRNNLVTSPRYIADNVKALHLYKDTKFVFLFHKDGTVTRHDYDLDVATDLVIPDTATKITILGFFERGDLAFQTLEKLSDI